MQRKTPPKSSTPLKNREMSQPALNAAGLDDKHMTAAASATSTQSGIDDVKSASTSSISTTSLAYQAFLNRGQLTAVTGEMKQLVQDFLVDWEDNIDAVLTLVDQLSIQVKSFSNVEPKGSEYSLNATMQGIQAEIKQIKSLIKDIKTLKSSPSSEKEIINKSIELFHRIPMLYSEIKKSGLREKFKKFVINMPSLVSLQKTSLSGLFLDKVKDLTGLDIKKDFHKLRHFIDKFIKFSDAKKEVSLITLQQMNLKFSKLMVELDDFCFNNDLDRNLILMEKLEILGGYSLEDYFQQFTSVYKYCLNSYGNYPEEELYPYQKLVIQNRIKYTDDKIKQIESERKILLSNITLSVNNKLIHKIDAVSKTITTFSSKKEELAELKALMDTLSQRPHKINAVSHEHPKFSFIEITDLDLRADDNLAVFLDKLKTVKSESLKDFFNELKTYCEDTLAEYKKALTQLKAKKDELQKMLEEKPAQAVKLDMKGGDVKLAVNPPLPLQMRKIPDMSMVDIREHFLKQSLPIINQLVKSAVKMKVEEQAKVDEKGKVDDSKTSPLAFIAKGYQLAHGITPQDPVTILAVDRLVSGLETVMGDWNQFAKNPYAELGITDYISFVNKNRSHLAQIASSLPSIIAAMKSTVNTNVLEVLSRFNLIMRELFLLLDKIETHFNMKEGCLSHNAILGKKSLFDISIEFKGLMEKNGYEFTPSEEPPYVQSILQQRKNHMVDRKVDLVVTPKNVIREQLKDKIALQVKYLIQKRDSYHSSSDRKLTEQRIQALYDLLKTINKKGFYVADSMSELLAKNVEAYNIIFSNDRPLLLQLYALEDSVQPANREKKFFPSISLVLSDVRDVKQAALPIVMTIHYDAKDLKKSDSSARIAPENEKYCLAVIDERLAQLHSKTMTSIRSDKIVILSAFKSALSKTHSLTEALKLVNTEHPSKFHLLYGSETGKMMKKIELALVSKERMLENIQLEIVRLKDVSKDIRHFFADARKLKVNNCVAVLEKVSAEIVREKNPDVNAILGRLLPAERTLLQDQAGTLLENLKLWENSKAAVVKLKK
jgi:hypothetical protein